MKAIRAKRILRIMACLALAAATTGCDVPVSIPTVATFATGSLAFSNLAAFASGWFLRDATIPTSTETQCFRNGQPIDCSQVNQ